jgi:type I restriction enzyme S subunit
LVKEGQFILSRIDARFGAMGMIPKEVDGAIVTNDFLAFDVNKNTIEQYLFYQLLKSPIFLEACKKASRGVTQRKRINEDFFLGYELTIPRRDAQKELCAKIELAEKGQETLKNQIENQKTYIRNLRKQILQDAIEGKLTKEWREQNLNIEPASELLKKITKEKEKLIAEKKIKREKSSPLIAKNQIPFEVPGDWVWVGISEIGLCFTGDSINESVKNLKYKVSKNGLNYIGTKDVGFECSGVNYNTGVVIPFDEAGTEFKIAKKGSIFICIEGGSSGKKIALLEQDVCFGNKLLATQVFKPVSYEYVYFVYQTFLFENEFKNKSKGLRGGVSVNIFKTIKIPLPPLQEQQAIVSKLQTLMQKLDEAEKQIEKSFETSKLLTKAILAEAFKGEVAEFS